MFKQARAYANLTPWERAILKAIEGCLVAGAISGLIVFLTAVTQANPDWGAALKIAATAFVVAFGFAALKYLKALQDPPLPTASPTASAVSLGSSLPTTTAGPTSSQTPPLAPS